MKGTIAYNINEPIHLAGPSPGDQSTIPEEEKKEYAETAQTDQPQVIDRDDPLGAAQQSSPDEITPPVQKAIYEETKGPKPSQTAEPTGGAATSAPSVDAPLRVKQQPFESADANQATLQAFASILAQQLDEKLEAKLS